MRSSFFYIFLGKGGGVIVAEVVQGSVAFKTKKLRRGMRLIEINNTNMETCTVQEAILALSLNARKKMTELNKNGIVTKWRIAPSRNLSAEGTKINKPPTPSKTIRRRWKRSIHAIILSNRTRKLADHHDTKRRVKEWIQTDIVDRAVHIGQAWQLKNQTDSLAWAIATHILEGGIIKGEYFKRKRACIAYMESTVVDISIPPPSFKPVSLALSRISSILKHPKQVFF